MKQLVCTQFAPGHILRRRVTSHWRLGRVSREKGGDRGISFYARGSQAFAQALSTAGWQNHTVRGKSLAVRGRTSESSSSQWSLYQLTTTETNFYKSSSQGGIDIVQNMEMDLKWHFYQKKKLKISDVYSQSRNEMSPLLENTHTHTHTHKGYVDIHAY